MQQKPAPHKIRQINILHPAGELTKLADPDKADIELQKQAYDLLIAKDFNAIDTLADEARTKKQRIKGGYWTLDQIYDGLTSFFADHPGEKVSDEMWTDRIDLLKQWKQKRAGSITVRVALAGAYIGFGETARGKGYSDPEGQDDPNLLSERLAKAESELNEAKTLHIQCPRWYR